MLGCWLDWTRFGSGAKAGMLLVKVVFDHGY